MEDQKLVWSGHVSADGGEGASIDREERGERLADSLVQAFRTIYETGINEDEDVGRRFFWARAATEALRKAGDPNPRDTINRLVGCRVFRYDAIGQPGRATCILVLSPEVKGPESLDADADIGAGQDVRLDTPKPLPDPCPMPSVRLTPRPRQARPDRATQVRQGLMPVCLTLEEGHLWTVVASLLSGRQPARTWNPALVDDLPVTRVRQESGLAPAEFALACERFVAADILAPVSDGYRVLRNPRTTPVITLGRRPLVLVSAARLERHQAARRLAEPWILRQGCVPYAAQRSYCDAVAAAWHEPEGYLRVLEEISRTHIQPPTRQGKFDGSIFVRLSRGLHLMPAALAPVDLVLADGSTSEEVVQPGAPYGAFLLRRATWRTTVSG